MFDIVKDVSRMCPMLLLLVFQNWIEVNILKLSDIFFVNENIDEKYCNRLNKSVLCLSNIWS